MNLLERLHLKVNDLSKKVSQLYSPSATMWIFTGMASSRLVDYDNGYKYYYDSKVSRYSIPLAIFTSGLKYNNYKLHLYAAVDKYSWDDRSKTTEELYSDYESGRVSFTKLSTQFTPTQYDVSTYMGHFGLLKTLFNVSYIVANVTPSTTEKVYTFLSFLTDEDDKLVCACSFWSRIGTV